MASSLQAGVGENSVQTNETAPCRIASEIDGMREEFLAQVCAIIGRKLTLEEVQALKDNPCALGHVQFEVDKVLSKIAGWKL